GDRFKCDWTNARTFWIGSSGNDCAIESVHSAAALRNRFCRGNHPAMPRGWREKHPRLRRMHRLRYRPLLFLSRRKRENRPHACAACVGLDRHLLVGAALERTNPALFRVRDEIEKFFSSGAALHGRSSLARLSNIQAARINKFERGFDFIAILGAETRAAYSDA